MAYADWPQARKFLAVPVNLQLPQAGRKVDAGPANMPFKQHGTAGFQAQPPTTAGIETPAMDAMEAAFRFNGFICINRKGGNKGRY